MMGLMEKGAQEGGTGHKGSFGPPTAGEAELRVWELLASPPHSPLLQIPSDVAFGACLSLCRASWLAQPPAGPQLSLTGVPMFKRGGAGGGCEHLVAGKELASVSTDTVCCRQRPGAWKWP